MKPGEQKSIAYYIVCLIMLLLGIVGVLGALAMVYAVFSGDFSIGIIGVR